MRATRFLIFSATLFLACESSERTADDAAVDAIDGGDDDGAVSADAGGGGVDAAHDGQTEPDATPGCVDGGAAAQDCAVVEGCPQDCSGHGACTGSACTCTTGYAGAACAECAAGWVRSGATCVVNPSCPQATCAVGSSECAGGYQRVCRVGSNGCAAWTNLELCQGKECECSWPADPAVTVMQWGMGSGNSGIHGLGWGKQGELLTAGSIGTNGENAAFVGAWSDRPAAWWQQWGSGNSVAHGLAVDASGAVFVTGQTEGLLPNGAAAMQRAATLTKFGADGMRAWTASWDSASGDIAYAVALHPSGDLLVAGDTLGELQMPNAGMYDAFVSRVSAAGSIVWTRQWGGFDIDGAYAIAVDASGGIYVAGGADGNAYCKKLDGNGTELWSVTWSSSAYDTAKAITLVDGGVVVVGQAQATLGGSSPAGSFVSRVSAAGVQLWTHQFTASGVTTGGATAVTLGPQDTLYIAGQTPGELVPGAAGGVLDAYLQARKLSDGSVVFTKQVGGAYNDQVYAVAAKADGTVYVAGRTSGGFPQFMGFGGARIDAFLLRFAPGP